MLECEAMLRMERQRPFDVYFEAKAKSHKVAVIHDSGTSRGCCDRTLERKFHNNLE